MLDKLREMAGPEANVLESDADGDTIVIGPNADYRAEVLKDGDLGDNDVFKDVVREADQAQHGPVRQRQRVRGRHRGGGGRRATRSSSRTSSRSPGSAMTGWVDDDVAHAVLRLTTD